MLLRNFTYYMLKTFLTNEYYESVCMCNSLVLQHKGCNLVGYCLAAHNFGTSILLA